TLRKVTYDEVAEIAHLGAKVVHPRAAEIAMNYGIPLWVKSTFSDDEGTEIVPREVFPGRRLTGVTHTGKLVYLQFDLTRAPEADRVELESKIYSLAAKYGANLFMLNLSPGGTGFAVPRSQYPSLSDLLDGLVLPINEAVYVIQLGHASRQVETQSALLDPLGNVKRIRAELTEGCSMVSMIGHEYMQQAGLFRKVLGLLAENQISVLQTSDSDFSLSVLVPESDAMRTVRLLHDRFPFSAVV
ncbi:MAG TPA: ACT domain-containing protein, partial [Fimbriimonadaceae bacterium]|nr:ACT domain-containing protein [Fimbriimonadaceae bacterium]